MSGKIIINATLTTVQPVSIKLPDQDGHPRMTRGLDSDGHPKKTAYIPATTVRGKLRRLAVQPLMEAAAAAGKPWTLHQVYEAMLGQDAASETNEEIDLVALKQRRLDNHIVDLFGAGLGVKSRLSVGHFMPMVDVQAESFAGVRKDLDSDLDVLALMDADEVGRFVDRNANNSKRAAAEALVKKLSAQIRKAEKADKAGQDLSDLKVALTLAESQRDVLVAAMGEMKNSTKTLTSYEAMPAGIELKSRLIIEKASNKDLQTLLAALDLFSRSPVLGGQTARGCGEVAGRFEISDQQGALLGVIGIGGYAPSTVNWTASGQKIIAKMA
jgi:CRISPR type IV-associated protein Csf2